MKDRINAHCLFLIGLLVIMLFLGVYALSYENLQTKLMPVVVCFIGIFLVANEFRLELARQKKKAPEVAAQKREMVEDEDNATVGSYVIGFAWVIGLFLSMYLIGFMISTLLFVFIYMITHGRSLLASCITSAIMWGSLYLATVSLQMYLFPGILFGG